MVWNGSLEVHNLDGGSGKYLVTVESVLVWGMYTSNVFV